MHLGVRSCVHVEVHEREHERAGVHAFPRAHGRFACVRLPVSVHEVSARCICIKALSESWRTSVSGENFPHQKPRFAMFLGCP